MREMIEEMVDEMLDNDGVVTVAGMEFYPSAIIKEMDPTAYRIMCSDFADNMIEDLRYDLERLDEEIDADEVADLRERIELLESI